MCIDARRDMETKLRHERDTLKAEMNSTFASEKESALNSLTLAKDREIRMLQRSWEDEKGRFDRENKRLQTQFDQEVNKQVRDLEIRNLIQLFNFSLFVIRGHVYYKQLSNIRDNFVHLMKFCTS